MLHTRRWFTSGPALPPCAEGVNRHGRKRTRLSILNSSRSLELFYGKICIGVNANFAGDAHGFHRQVFGGQFRVFEHRARGREGVTAARANSHESVVGLDDV